MSKKKKTIFEFLRLDEETRALILKICDGSSKVMLTDLDKGLSGSKVFLAKWIIKDSNQESKFHVFKIGKTDKLDKEMKAINEIAAPLIKDFPNATLKTSDDGSMAILCQQFMGDDESGVNESLKQFIERVNDHKEVERIVNKIYTEKLIKWSSKNIKGIDKNYSVTLKEELEKWLRKANLKKASEQIGSERLNSSLSSLTGVSLYAIEQYINKIGNEKIKIKKGPVHGDLHSQNVVLDFKGGLSLIDFGWTAIRWRAVDFIWLECSLKFVVSCPYAKLEDLIYIENLIDNHWDREDEIDYEKIKQLIHGKELANIVCGIATIRKNAIKLKSVKSIDEYRKGLIMMSYSLTTFPQLNRVFLFHSIANNIGKVYDINHMVGPYDKLYKNTELLWPSTPGRMVKKAIERIPIPGKCLDLGCGDAKNFLYLEKHGWKVDGIDISPYAIESANKRLEKDNFSKKGTLIRENVTLFKYKKNYYDLIVCYGLYHCLNDADLTITHKNMIKSLKKGGLIAFATLNDNLPYPTNHFIENDKIFLRPQDHIFKMVKKNRLNVLEKEIGEIEESHLPLVGQHKHALTWALFQKPL